MKRKIEISAACVKNNICWFVSNEVMHLYCKDLNSEKVIDCGKIPFLEIGKEKMYRTIECINNKVYLIPYNSKVIIVYDIEKTEYYRIELDMEIIGKAKYLFHASFLHDKYIYAIGVHTRVIIKIDSITDSVTYIYGWEKDLVRKLKSPQGILSRNQIAYDGNMIYCPLFYADGYLTIDLSCDKVEHVILQSKNSGYTGIGIMNKKIVLISKGPKIQCVSVNSDLTVNILEVFDENKITGDKKYYLAIDNNKIKILGNEVLKAERNNKDVEVLEGIYECIGSNETANYFINDDNNTLLLFGEENKSFSIEIDMTEEIYNQIYNSNNCVSENSRIGIKEFIEDIITYGNK